MGMNSSSCCADVSCGSGLDAMGLRKRVSAAPAPRYQREDQDQEPQAQKASKESKPVASKPAKSSLDDDDDWDEIEPDVKKNSLEATSLISHSVHCPNFPSDKQEYWWLYLCDKKKSDLITVPVRVTNLVDTQEIDVKFPAPRKPGVYQYTMCLKSDSYLDMDLTQNLKFDVKEAKVIESHPQWEISDDEEDKALEGDNDGSSLDDDDDSEFEYDED